MSDRVGVVVRCADLLPYVYTTVRSVEDQTDGPTEVVLVTDESTPDRARPWLERFAATRGHGVVTADGSTPGASANEGVRATAAPYVVCLDAGDRLEPDFVQACRSRLDDDPDAGVVSSRLMAIGPGSQRQELGLEPVDLEALLGDANAIPGPFVVRREAWAELGGFDDKLPVLAHHEFWIRVLRSGRHAAAVPQPLATRVLRRSGLYRRSWDDQATAAAMESIVTKHADVFGASPPSVLRAMEAQLAGLARRHETALARHEGARQDLASLEQRRRDLEASKPDTVARPFDFADLRRTTPVSRDWGYDRGTPVDRYYIERFLERCAADVRGAVLEVQEPGYTERFGGDRVTRSDVVDLNAANPRATVISDLRAAANIPDDTYDCIVLTQTLHVVDDIQAVIAEVRRILKPGGVLLATLPSVSRVVLEYGQDGDFWRVTEAGARQWFGDVFSSDELEIEACGNVLTNTAFLYGLAVDDLTPEEFDASDPFFPLLVTVRARKAP